MGDSLHKTYVQYSIFYTLLKLKDSFMNLHFLAVSLQLSRASMAECVVLWFRQVWKS